MIYHVAEVISVSGKHAALRLLDAENLCMGEVVSYFHNEKDAQGFKQKLDAKHGKLNTMGAVKHVVVSY